MAVELEDKVLGAEDILSANDIEFATVPGFKPGEVFRIRSLSAGDLIEWNESNEGEAKRTAGLRMIIKSLVDADGKLLFTDKHLQALRNKSYKITERLLKEILKHNGIVTDKQKDTAAKND